MAENQVVDGKLLAKTILARHRITNGIGIPIVFIYFLYSLSGGASTIFANVDQMTLLAVLSVTIILASVITHERINLRLVDPSRKFLDNPDKLENESTVEYNQRTRNAIKCLLDFSFHGAVISLVTWPVTIMAIILVVYFTAFKFPMSLMLVMFFGGVSGGILVAVFQFYLFKHAAQPFLREVLKHYPHYWKEAEFLRFKFGLRKKLLVSFICLMFVMMSMMATLMFFDTSKMIHSQWGEMVQKRIEREVVKFGPELASAKTPEERQTVLDKMNIEMENGEIHLINREGKPLLSGTYTPAQKEIFARVAGTKKGINIGEDLTLMSPFPGKKNLALDLEPGDFKINTWVEVPDSGQILLLRRSFRSFLPSMYRLIIISVLTVLGGVLVSVFFTHSASRDVTEPVYQIVEIMEKVGSGELTRELNLLTYDEMGTLAINLRKMIENLRAMIYQIGEASHRVEEATISIVEGFKKVSEGSRTQSSAVDETSAALDEMDASIKGIGENVETLASTAEQSSSSILEMSATIEEVADNAENLASSVEETTSSIGEMAASVRQVAENVESLSRKTESTVASVNQMEASIKEVQASAEETAQLTERVSGEAESGANKVQDTIHGISRALRDSELAVKVIHELAQRAEEIGNILNVIDDVTDETNLLALNAAIIAAQAGEHGRGFAVVADEIKDLAERTAQSTQEIANLIEAVQNGAHEAVDAVNRGFEAVEQGTKLSRQAGETLSQILESAQKSTERTHNIAKATVEQAQRAKDVLRFFEEISENIHQVETATKEQSKGADQIQNTAERMREIAKLVKKATQEQFLGSKQINQAMENINQIVAFINNSQREQIKNTEQVVQAIQEIRTIASQNESGVEEMFRASANLSSLAEDLRSMVEAFKVEQDEGAGGQ